MTTGRTRRRGAGGRDETSVLLESLLQSRGMRGATQDDLRIVVAWAESTRAEGEALQNETGRRRRGKGTARGAAAAARQQEQLRERVMRHAMNRALLDGVVAGRVSLDVKEEQLVFLHGQPVAAQTAAAAADADSAVDAAAL